MVSVTVLELDLPCMAASAETATLVPTIAAGTGLAILNNL